MLNIISKEMQIKTTMTYHYTAMRMVVGGGGDVKTENTKRRQKYSATRTIIHCW